MNKKIFEITGNFWVDMFLILFFPWFVVAISFRNKFNLHWGKIALIGIVALLVSNYSFFSNSSYEKKYNDLLSKYEKLQNKDSEKLENEKKAQTIKIENDKKITVKPTIKATQKLTLKPTIKPTKKPVEKKKVSTMANKARAKLKGRVDLPYLDAINILISIDALVDPINEEKISDSYYEYVWIQTFKFSDGSKIRVSKYQEDGEFIFMAILAN